MDFLHGQYLTKSGQLVQLYWQLKPGRVRLDSIWVLCARAVVLSTVVCWQEASPNTQLQGCKFQQGCSIFMQLPRKAHLTFHKYSRIFSICLSLLLLPKHTWKNNPQGPLQSEMATVIESINLMDQSLPFSSHS